jgi:hypothetical protein
MEKQVLSLQIDKSWLNGHAPPPSSSSPDTVFLKNTLTNSTPFLADNCKTRE